MMPTLRRQRRGLAALIVLALVMATLAVLHRGVPAAQLQLNDGGVWVTNQALRLVGHLNYPSRTIDGGVRAASGQFDVAQHGNTVVVTDAGSAKVQNVDTAVLTLGDGAPLAKGVVLAQGGQTAVATDSEAGKVWLLDAADIGAFRPDTEPTLDKVPGVRASVGPDGGVLLVLPDGTVKKLSGDRATDAGRIEGIADLATAQLTMVGDTIVVLDKASGTVRTPRGSAPVDNAAKLVLQQPGAAADRVLLAGPDARVSVPLAGGTATVTPTGAGAGTPAAPAVLDGCAYFAWGGSGAYVRDCPADPDDRAQTVDNLRGSSQLAFRVNRDVIVLNDLANGSILLVNDDMKTVDNWQVIDSTTKQAEDQNNTSTQTVDEPSQAQKKNENTKPDAQDDEYGVRPGRTVTLPVLENDTDADSDLLTASVKEQPQGLTVAQVRGGEALNLAVPESGPERYTFTYTADDGRGGTDDAKVAVRVFPLTVNEAPVQKRTSTVTLGQRGEASYAVLGDYRDPESDSIYVVGTDQPAGLSVKSRPDGVITVKDLGVGGVGIKDVHVQVSDGNKAVTGVLKVNVRDTKLPPTANTDHVMALKGEDVVVRPLANDVDPNGGQLRLTQVAPPAAGQTIKPDYAGGSFTFSSTTPGVYYVSYQVANDAATPSLGHVRIDVAEPVAGAPVAADDLAMLPAGGSVIVDALANDSDPGGGVLVLTSVKTPPDAGVAVEILDHARLRMSAPAGLLGPVDIGYTVSNGAGNSSARVTVVPLPPTATATAPIAVNDRAVVRVNDIVTVPVLANDQSPSGMPLTIDPKVTIEGDAAAGDAFASRDVVRFRANKPGTFRVNYTVRDAAQNYSTAQIVVTVNPLDMPNTPPVPQPVTGRVIAGQKVVIPVPLDGIDPEGDSVSLVGLGSAPTKGTAVAGADTIEYSVPAGASGTDLFTYEIADRFGAKATSTIRVGIAPPNATNQSPVALPDDVATRPGRALTVNPVANDSDPDGDTLVLIGGSVTPTDAETTTPATTAGDLIELTTPEEETTLRYYYGVSDGRGGAAKGVVSVRVSKDAVLKPPVARDDVVTPAQVKDVASVEVDVLANDYDPDGSVRDLKVSTSDAGASVTGTKVVVPVTEQRQVILYTITDPGGMTARAAVIVPGVEQAAAPFVITAKMPLRVKAGELLTIPLAEYVTVRAGHSPRLTFAAKAVAGAGADTTEVVKDATTLQFRSTPEFSGTSSVTFEVTDGTGPDDPQGKTATLTIPIIVEAAPAAKHPPVFTPSEVTAAAGEAATVANLAEMVTDPDPGDTERLKFELGAVSPGFTVRLNGARLEVSAPANATPGTTGTAELTVTDGSTPPVPGTVTLRVLASTRPLITTSTVTINDAKAGSPSSVDLAPHIVNPFAAEGKPVTLVGAPVVTGATGATVTADGLKLTITPPTGFHGQMVVTYTLADATESPARHVRGTIQLTVRDRPDAPSAVVAETHLSRTVTVSWTAGANNGAPITGFTVYWAGGSKACGQATNCLIDGLVNNTTYTFQVSATNEVGESDKSPASNAVRPDVKPNPPGTPVGTFGDKQVALTWAAATTDGSPVTSYTVEISPAASGATQQTTSGTSLTWTGLTNGTAYTFRVRAHSAAPTPSDWSGASAPVVPAGPPGQPAAPSAVKDPVSALPPSATVSWNAPNPNGDSNLSYEMRRTGTTTVLYSGTGTSAHVTMSVSTTDQTFEVRAKNKAGWGAWSGPSNPVRAFQTPGAVTSLAITPTGANNQVKISFGAAPGNGAQPSEITYYWRANGVTQSIAAGGGTVTNATAFPNGTNVSVAVYAVSRVNGETAQGASTSATVNAYGPPISPTINCTSGQDQKVSCSWSGGAANGRPTTYVLSGGASGTVGASGSTTVATGYSSTVTVCIQAQQNTGLTGARNCDSGTSAPKPPPQPSVTVSKGTSAVGQPGCASSSCAYIVVTTKDFANATVSCDLYWPSLAASWTQGGNATRQLGQYYGYPGRTVTVTCNGVSGSLVWY